MNTVAVLIRPTKVFKKPYNILAGNIIMAPNVFPFNERYWLYLANGRRKAITLLTEITTSPEAWQQNLHGFTYSGDSIEENDLVGDVLVSNLDYEEALRIYRDYTGRSSARL